MPESMEKRILLSFALSFLVLLIFYQFVYSPPPPDPAGTPDETLVSPEVAAPPSVPEAPSADAPAEPVETAETVIQAAAAEVLTVETAVFTVSISNEGAVIRSLRLRDYRGAADETLELIDADVDQAAGWPLEIETGDAAVDDWLRSGLWAAERDGNEVLLELAGGGRRAFKRFTFDETGYGFRFAAGVEESGRVLPVSAVWQGSFGDQSTEYTPGEINFVYQESGGFERLNAGSVEEAQSLPPTQYLGLEDQYFIAMFRASEARAATVESRLLEVPGEDEAIPVARAEFSASGDGLELYVGPKQRDHLGAIDPALVSIIDYGFFEILARPLLGVLLWIQGYVGNFGWSIVLMTLLINVGLFPLRLKQQLAMAKMQKIQPQMRTLQDKYKKLKPNDPRRQEVQSEMMGLYKKHGVNPLGGCLPLVLQMPIFFAIFQLLRSAIELRQAPWVFWIRDLSVYDPYYVLPVLMGVSMLATQRLTPTAMDPAQARIMMFMPLMFMVFMIRVQSGLVLYWLTSNLVGVGQQLFINRYWTPRTTGETASPPEKPAEIATAPPPVSPAPSGPSGESAQRRRRRKR